MPQNPLLATFTAYNQAIWPVQIALLLFALGLVVLAVRGRAGGGRMAYAVLAVLWAWCGGAFWLLFYARYAVRPVAYVFGAAFLVQALLFGHAALVERASRVALRTDAYGVLGATLIGFALLVYPLLASALGQHYPAQPTFGAPCPLAIFSFGMLLLVRPRVPGHLLAIPFAWALLGVFPVVRFGILEDIGLVVAGLVGLPSILAHNRRSRPAPSPATSPGVGETPAPAEGIRRLH